MRRRAIIEEPNAAIVKIVTTDTFAMTTSTSTSHRRRGSTNEQETNRISINEKLNNEVREEKRHSQTPGKESASSETISNLIRAS